MTHLGPTWRGVGAHLPGARDRARTAAGRLAILLALACLPAGAHAAPFIWDQDEDRVDDRIETVHLLGYRFSFEQGDSLLRQRIAVGPVPGGLLYSVYVVYANEPTTADLAALAGLGMPALHRYGAVPAVRSQGTFPQIEAAASLPGVERIEAVPVLYPQVREGAAAAGMRDPSGQVFPTWSVASGAAGEGVVVAILDTGVNDAPESGYPGHESLLGRCLGGAVFTHGDSLLDTPRDGSVNPVDHGSGAHGTHVAGIILGDGGATGFATGVAPLARFVDVKVLNDLGVGTGVAEALDWCIHNRARAWGAGPAWDGIDVVNLAFSSLDPADGNDIASRLADRAVELGMVVVASMGNEGEDQRVPSPAAGDRVLAVGAFDGQRTAAHADDRFADFSDYGPRMSDGDLDAHDEQKPDLIAAGVAILAADGSLASDGAQYRRRSGTSMSAAFVSGAAAVLLSDDPTLTPGELAALLRATAWRPLAGVPPGSGGVDPGWHSPRGFGALDLPAARLERTQPGRSQVRRLELAGAGDHVTATLVTMRERGAAHFVLERAPDTGGLPGAFAAFDSVPAAGDSSLADGTNHRSYAIEWTVPPAERGGTHWYRVSYTEGGARHDGPARAFTSPVGDPVATVEVTIVHNAYDHDLDGAIELGGGTGLAGGVAGSTPAISIALPGTAAAVASEWVTGSSALGNIAWSFAIPIPAGLADAYLPPGPGAPWRLRVSEGGYLNRAGRVTGYRVIWHSPWGDQSYAGGPLPIQTFEGQTAYAAAPAEVVGVDGTGPAAALRFGPNPVRGGREVVFALARAPGDDLRVFDLAGREVGRAPFVDADGGAVARWSARHPDGRPLAAGLYFARAGAHAARLVLIGR